MNNEYWKEAEALADALIPIPPIACLDENGVVVVDDKCSECPMKAQCELKTGRMSNG